MIEDFTSRKAGIDFHSQGFGLLPEPLHKVAQPDNVVSVVVHGHPGEDGDGDRARLGQNIEFVLGDGRVEWRALVLPVWDQLV